MKKAIALLLSVLIIGALMSGCVKEINNTSVDIYNKFALENGNMPQLSSLGDYKSVGTLYHQADDLFFEWKAYTLIAEYEEVAFETAAEEMRERYVFQNAALIDKVEEYTHSPDFELDGYSFSVLALNVYSQEDSEFPEEIYFVGVNKSLKRIAYVYFYDPDLDYVESLDHILTEYCGWGKIDLDSDKSI